MEATSRSGETTMIRAIALTIVALIGVLLWRLDK
jgi:hypothetical protein